MNFLILGSTGYIGQNLVRRLLADGHLIYVLSRNKDEAFEIFRKQVIIVNWEDLKHNHLHIKFETIDCVINLAGESLSAKKWTTKTKAKLVSSRINTTRLVLDLIANKTIKPKVLINASAVGYYGHNNNDILNESSPAGNDFLANLCKQWEVEAHAAEKYDIRVVCLRIGMVLGKEGALKKMLSPYKYFIGGSLGNGKQCISWIHIDDLINIIVQAALDKNLNAAVNATAPNAVTMNEFSKTLGKVMHRPSFINAPAFILKLILGEMSVIILKGQRVYPEKLISSGFKFNYPSLTDALVNILKNNEGKSV